MLEMRHCKFCHAAFYASNDAEVCWKPKCKEKQAVQQAMENERKKQRKPKPARKRKLEGKWYSGQIRRTKCPCCGNVFTDPKELGVHLGVRDADTESE